MTLYEMYDRVVPAWRFLLCFLAFFVKGRELRKAKRRLPLTVRCQSAHEHSAFVFITIKRCNTNSTCDCNSALACHRSPVSFIHLCVRAQPSFEPLSDDVTLHPLIIIPCCAVGIRRCGVRFTARSLHVCSCDVQLWWMLTICASVWQRWCTVVMLTSVCSLLPLVAFLCLVQWQRWKSFRSWGTDPRRKTEWRPSTAALCVRHPIVHNHHALLLLSVSHHVSSSDISHICTVLILFWPIQWWHGY